jgi:DNA mismatch repair protein MutS
MSAKTPMFQQYHAIKARHRDAILMFRMGDFYEMFYEDALEASRALQITLTARGKGTASEAPMCGVPFHSVDGYIARLTTAGYKVAICEQLEDPSQARGLVKRDVIRVVTPGTVTDARHLEAGEPNTLGAVCALSQQMGFAWVDLSTGDFRVAEFHGDLAGTRGMDLLSRFNCREILLPEEIDPAGLGDLRGLLLNRREGWRFGLDRGREALTRHFGTAHLAGFGLEEPGPAMGAAGALLDYLGETQKADLTHIDRIRRYQSEEHLLLDRTTIANLEILRTQREGKRQGSLLGLLDRTVTAMGGRLLKERITQPLRDRSRIRRRLAIVADLTERATVRARLRERLAQVGDIERLLARLTLGTAGPRDLKGLGESLARLAPLRGEGESVGAEPLRALLATIDAVPEAGDAIQAAIVDEPPAAVRDGGLIRDGHDEALDELRSLARDGKQFIAALEAREREATGVASLKVRYNRVFGYFIEVSKANASRVPEGYIRKQTLASSERFATQELKETEEKILTAEERSLARETEIFEALRQEVLTHSSRLRTTAGCVARLDVAAALADVGARSEWCVPEVSESAEIFIGEGRHPVVEAALGRDRFVPNDIRLDGESRQIQIITGPNMGGKSTLLRQVGLAVILAQVGSLVPARRAVIGLTDRVFCRVGASDSLAEGHSTFMVEMTETANILHHATPASLVLLDEIGRGTATFDGLSLAWAVVEHLHDHQEVAARTLFATHYHELTELALVLPHVLNLKITAREHDGRIVFLHRLEEGAADQSYGIQVAALAGVPREVVDRAREILGNLESEAVGRDGRPKLARHAGERARGQMALFGARPKAPSMGGKAAALAKERTGDDASSGPGVPEEIFDAVRATRPEDLTPLEALQFLDRLARRARGEKEAAKDPAARKRQPRPRRPTGPSEPPATG